MHAYICSITADPFQQQSQTLKQHKADVAKRKLGERTGLKSIIVQAENLPEICLASHVVAAAAEAEADLVVIPFHHAVVVDPLVVDMEVDMEMAVVGAGHVVVHRELDKLCRWPHVQQQCGLAFTSKMAYMTCSNIRD